MPERASRSAICKPPTLPASFRRTLRSTQGAGPPRIGVTEKETVSPMQAALILIIIGVLLGMPTALFAYNNPRRKGEPLGSQRKALIGLSSLGIACALVGAGMLFLPR